MKLAFQLAAGICILSLAILFGTALYLQFQRPVVPDVTNGFIIPIKIVRGIVFVKEGEQTFLDYLSLFSFFSILGAFSLKILSKK